MLTQAKSGMGKTAVFVLTILHSLPKDAPPVSALVLCHTRELAYQIHKEFVRLGKYIKELKSRVFYGGEPIEDQKKALKTEAP
jgi:ATP-dependent RNA helicase UAP56/SUB2